MLTLYIVATPIGNLEDISLRALRILKEVDVIFAEDTRVTGKLLNHFDVDTQLKRYDEHSHDKQKGKILNYLQNGQDVALVSDAGTPGISDPGARLVSFIRDQAGDRIKIVPIPGPSSITTALSVAGLSSDSFCFWGYVPHKKGRQTFFQNLAEVDNIVVFFESPHRLMKTLLSLSENLSPKRRIVIAKELTKVHEEIVSGSSAEVLKYFDDYPDKKQGEFVLIVEPRK